MPIRVARAGRALAAWALALTAVMTAGCGGEPGRAPASTTACAAVAVRAAQRHAAVTALPAPCRGLGAAGLGIAVRIAVSRLAGHGDKARKRHLAGLARTRMRYLIQAASAAQAQAAARDAARQAAARRLRLSRRPGPAGSARGPAGRGGVPRGLAAIACWLLTAASGGVILGGWIRRRLRSWLTARSGPRGPAAAAPAGRPHGLPVVLVSHVCLALAGLAAWACYLTTGWVPLAWAAFGALLPVAGLGMAALVQVVPDAEPAAPAPGVAAARPGRRTARAGRRGPPVLAIAVHGLLATVTLLLVLLAATAAASR